MIILLAMTFCHYHHCYCIYHYVLQSVIGCITGVWNARKQRPRHNVHSVQPVSGREPDRGAPVVPLQGGADPTSLQHRRQAGLGAHHRRQELFCRGTASYAFVPCLYPLKVQPRCAGHTPQLRGLSDQDSVVVVC